MTPQGLEQAAQGERPRDAYHGEDRTHFQVLRQRRLQPEDREDQDLRDDRDAVGDGWDILSGLVAFVLAVVSTVIRIGFPFSALFGFYFSI